MDRRVCRLIEAVFGHCKHIEYQSLTPLAPEQLLRSLQPPSPIRIVVSLPLQPSTSPAMTPPGVCVSGVIKSPELRPGHGNLLFLHPHHVSVPPLLFLPRPFIPPSRPPHHAGETPLKKLDLLVNIKYYPLWLVTLTT